MQPLIRIAETGYVPDAVLRMGIRRLLRQRLRNEQDTARDDLRSLAPKRIAVAPERANEQHYELPPGFFRLMLGSRLKYSSCHWSSLGQSIDRAEEEMLALTCERAGVEDGMRVLDLGCGWGSLGLWVAERYPDCRVTLVSNAESQQRSIRDRAARQGFGNVATVRADVNEFEPSERFDRIVSVEMFEHVRNHARLLSRIARWLEPDGFLFVHLFCHREFSYPFEVETDSDWMARHFFTGGVMPSIDLLSRFDRDLTVEQFWTVGGKHYERTLLAWLDKLDGSRPEALQILEAHYGRERARLWFVRWRLFLLSCAELFGYRNGQEWMVAHYRMRRSVGGQ